MGTVEGVGGDGPGGEDGVDREVLLGHRVRRCLSFLKGEGADPEGGGGGSGLVCLLIQEGGGGPKQSINTHKVEKGGC